MGVKPVVVRSWPATAAVLVVGLVMAGMMMTAAMMLVARPAAMTVRRWRSSTAETRTGRSRSWKLREARAVATSTVRAMVAGGKGAAAGGTKKAKDLSPGWEQEVSQKREPTPAARRPSGGAPPCDSAGGEWTKAA